MGLKGITVNTAAEAEAHIYAEDDAAIYQSILGMDAVADIGQQCKATVISNNKIRVSDGVVVVGGHVARIPYGEYEDCEIANGQTGKNRNDLIVARFETTGSGGVDKMTCKVYQGTAGSTAADPSITQDNIYQNGKVREFPLYRVRIEGLNIVSVDQLFTVLPSMATMQEDMTPSTETLKSGVRLQRMGKLRILNLVDTSSAADGTIVNLAAGDRPANYVFAPATVRGQTYPDFFISVTPASMGTGKVGLFRGANVQMQYDGYICSQIAWLVD